MSQTSGVHAVESPPQTGLEKRGYKMIDKTRSPIGHYPLSGGPWGMYPG